MRRVFKSDETCTWIIPPKYVTMLSGVVRIHAAHPRYELLYTDGSHEGRKLDKRALAVLYKADGSEAFDFLSIVSAVQSMRGEEVQP